MGVGVLLGIWRKIDPKCDSDDDDDDDVEGGGLGRTGGSRVIALGDGSRGTATPLTPTKK